MSLFYESRESVIAALEEAGLQRFAELIKPCVRLTPAPTPDVAIPVGASKLGGSPDLPVGFSWPSKEEAPLSFLAQIDLEDVAPFETAHLLPRSGLLSFFYDGEQSVWGFDPKDHGSWMVAWTPASEALSRRAPPAVGLFEQVSVPCRLSFSASVSLPSTDAIKVEELGLNSEEEELYGEILDGFMTSQPSHQLFGEPDQVQNEMQLECQLVSNGIYFGDSKWFSHPRTAELRPGAKDWRLLLQLDSDDVPGLMWGDSGLLYFWIHQKALQAREFGNVWLVLQCS